MTTATLTRTTATPTRPAILSGPLTLVFVSNLLAMSSFYLLLSVVPMYAASIGVGGVGAGLATGVLMLSTVAAELVTPRMVARYGYKPVLVAGLLLLGVPALALPGAGSMAAILAVCLVRGVGFAIVVVLGGALVAELVPAERRGEALGLSGVVSGIPAVVALPLGIWLVGQTGYSAVFVAGAFASLAAIAAVLALPVVRPAGGKDSSFGIVAGLRTPSLVSPAVIFSATAMAGGILVTFLPAAVAEQAGVSGGLAAVGLLVQAATATAGRWWAGRFGDRHGAARLLVPSVLVAALGMLGLTLTSSPTAVLVAMAVFGAGFGAAQNSSLALMYSRVSPSGYGTVSALWNLAFDAGYGVGAVGFGVLAAQTGYPMGFALTALLMPIVLATALRRHERP